MRYLDCSNAWKRDRTIETYSYNDRQVMRIANTFLLTGLVAGCIIGAFVHTLIGG